MFDIHTWKKLALHLKRIKTEEAEMRREGCAEIIGQTEMTNGAVTVKTVIDGYEVKAKQALSFTIDQAALGTIWDELNEQERACINLKPTLALAAYKKLPEDSLLHEAIVSRLAMPTLSAEEIEV